MSHVQFYESSLVLLLQGGAQCQVAVPEMGLCVADASLSRLCLAGYLTGAPLFGRSHTKRIQPE